MSILKLLPTTTLVLAFHCLIGQPTPLHFEHLTSEAGLSQNDVNCILQDQQGFLWFGTHDGLNRYDGYNFEVFQFDPNDHQGISSNLIFTLSEDQQGNLWVGTTGGGINRFEVKSGRFTRFVHNPDRSESLSSDYILSSLVDHQGQVWIGTVNGINRHVADTSGLIGGRFDHFFSDHSQFPDSRSHRINTIFQSRSGEFWVGTSLGLYKAKATQLTADHPEFQLVGERTDIRTINEDQLGNLIIGTVRGLYQLDLKQKASQFEQIITVRGINTTVVEPNGEIWSGSNQGVFRFSREEGATVPKLVAHYTTDVTNPHSLNKNIVKHLFLDKSGIIWIGTNGGGVNKFNPQKKAFRHYRKNLQAGSISYDKIRSIFEDSQRNVWMGTEGGGVNLLMAGNSPQRYNSFQHFGDLENVFAIEETFWNGQRNIWLGSESAGVYRLRFEDDGQIVMESTNSELGGNISVFSLLEDRLGNLWVGTYNKGLLRLSPDEKGGFTVSMFLHNPAEPTSISNNIVRSLLQDRHGDLWIGTGNGLNKIASDELQREQPRFVHYKNTLGDTTSISFNYILALHESAAGELWVGTFGGGLNRLITNAEGEARFSTFNEKDGLANNVVKSILEDDSGDLWIATNRGLSRFNPLEGQFKNYHISDGLQSSEFSELAAFKRQNGEMLFGGINGFNVFYPNCIEDNLYQSQAAITDFQIFNQSVPIGETFNDRVLLEEGITWTNAINLKYWENSFSFEFSALHFAAPDKNQYAYKLEGFDDNWVYTTADKRFATYTNLKHGNYTFRVKASNNDGVWSEESTALAVSIAPPFWLNWWAYLLYGIAFIAAVWFIRKYTLIGIHEKHQLELEHLDKEKSEELHQMKMRFFTNISHEFRTPLTLILGPLEYLLQFGNQVNREDRAEHYLLMQKNARFLLRLVNQLMDFRKLDQGKMKLVLHQEPIGIFVQEVSEPFQFVASKKNVDFRVENQVGETRAWIDKDKLEKILYNLLSNAFKFTPEHGQVSAEVSAVPASQRWPKGGVKISIQDSGKGISREEKRHIFERFYQSNQRGKGQNEGSGIGLSFTKNLVDLHQGDISFQSVLGEGTCFTVVLPLGKSAYKQAEFVQEPVIDVDFSLPVDAWLDLEEKPIKDSLQSNSNLPQLLVVDDHADIRAFVRQAFIEEYQVLEAENGVEGLRVAEEDQPDIIIADVMMPEMDGIEMCRRLKTNSDTSHIPIIMLTAKDTEASQLEGLKTRAEQYLTKPFNLEMLQVSVSNLINVRNELKKRFNRDIYAQPSEVAVTSADEIFLKKAVTLVEENIEDPNFNVEALVKDMGMSRSKLHLKMKAITGQSCSEFIRTIRLKRAVQLMEKSDLSVKEIMYQTGFNTASYFSKCFKKQFGVIPSEYLKKDHAEQAEVE
ncbi:MAG: two-component regulator propeller domain-containing protein [Bacteroidota bacterium]